MGGLLVVVKKDTSKKKNRKNLRWVWWCWSVPRVVGQLHISSWNEAQGQECHHLRVNTCEALKYSQS